MKRVFLATGVAALAFLLCVEHIDVRHVPMILCLTAAVGILSAAVRFILGRKKHRKGQPYPGSRSIFEIIIAVCLSVCACGTVYVHKADSYNSVTSKYNGVEVDCT